MTAPRLAKVGLLVGGLGSCAMAAYHFFLPYAWDWDRSLHVLPLALQWGSHSINFFMSYLMFAGGVLTLAALPQMRAGRRPDRGIVAAMAIFWMINAAYQVIIPIPLPPYLGALRLVLLSYAIVVAGAHIVAFCVLGARSPLDAGRDAHA